MIGIVNKSVFHACQACGDVNISFGTALRFAQALKMDFTPVLTPEEGEE